MSVSQNYYFVDQLSRTMYEFFYIIAQGRSQDFSKGGSPSGDRRLYMVYTAALPRVSAGSVVLSTKKPNFKKVGFSTMAFTATILSWRFRHLNIVGCLLKRRPTKGGVTGTPGPPP